MDDEQKENLKKFIVPGLAALIFGTIAYFIGAAMIDRKTGIIGGLVGAVIFGVIIYFLERRNS